MRTVWKRAVKTQVVVMSVARTSRGPHAVEGQSVAERTESTPVVFYQRTMHEVKIWVLDIQLFLVLVVAK